MKKKKQYKEYKTVRGEWTEEIPIHWEMRKLARSYEKIGSGTTPLADNQAYYEGGSINWVNTGDLNDGVLSATAKKVTEVAVKEHTALKIFPAGSIALAMYGATIGKLSILNFPACTNQACCVLTKSQVLENRFVFYWLLANRTQLISMAYGGGQPNISQELVRGLRIPTPPGDEQRLILQYLDEKTTLIDETISKKERLIQLLQEERTALINKAVTRGLDDSVQLKDSGVEWLGRVPKHWEVKKLKYLSKIRYGLGQPPRVHEDGLPLIRATNVFRGKISPINMVFVDPEDVPWDRNPTLHEGDIVVVRSGAYTADSAMITKEYDGSIAGYDMVVTPTEVNNLFLSYSLLSNYVLINQLYEQRLRAAQPHLNREELGETFILTPPKSEQQRIAKHLDEVLNTLEATLAKIKSEISLLQEYRTALINEVVTGKRCVL